jgi:hypothetical protein
VEPVFVHDRLDRGHFGDLMSQRCGIIAIEVVTTTTALRRLAVDDLPEGFGRDQGSAMVAMADLPTPLPAGGGGRRSSLDGGRIGGGWLGRVGGVGVEPLLQVGDTSLQTLEPGPDGLLGLGWHGLPQ